MQKMKQALSETKIQGPPNNLQLLQVLSQQDPLILTMQVSYTHIHTRTYACAHTHAYLHVHTHTYTHAHAHTHTHTYTHTHTLTHTHTHTYTHTQTYMRRHTRTYTHTSMRTDTTQCWHMQKSTCCILCTGTYVGHIWRCRLASCNKLLGDYTAGD